MREILFRGKCLVSGDFIYGDLIQYEPIPCIRPINQDLGENYDYDEIEVDNKTMGQFTGLLDKKGNKIFEGDLLQIPGYYCEVKFIDGMFCSVYNHGEDGETLPLNELGTDRFEIIGNIHDHATL